MMAPGGGGPVSLVSYFESERVNLYVPSLTSRAKQKSWMDILYLRSWNTAAENIPSLEKGQRYGIRF
jgi:hypothetical protein